MPFACSICEQESTRICAYCTKDACANHICEHCGYCSDCCQCEVLLAEPAHVTEAAAAPQPDALAASPSPEPVHSPPPEEPPAEALEAPET